MEIIVYFINEQKFVLVDINTTIDLFYNKIAKIWFHDGEITQSNKSIYMFNNNQLIKTNNFVDDNYFKNIKHLQKKISSLNEKVPLYDVYSANVYLIYKENVYERVMYNYYRFIDKKFLKKNINKFEFLRNYNLKVLNRTYLSIFYYYSVQNGKNITTCIRPSFLSHLKYIKPYYKRDEIINLALNFNLIEPSNEYYDNSKIEKLCKLVRNNDINKNILMEHQKYIVDNNGIHGVIYYSLSGAFFVNRYLRDIKLVQNKLLEKNIKFLNDLIRGAPAFDKKYIVYRFIHNDTHINHLKIGDYYIDPSFISTTRNPFYDLAKLENEFGFIVILIHIPDDVKGIALCIESFSNFQSEEEIIFAPFTKLKLISKNKNTNYYHSDINLSRRIATRYEFEFVNDMSFTLANRTLCSDVHINIDNINMFDSATLSFNEKIMEFVKNYTNKNFQFIVTINTKQLTFTCETYDSTTVYKPFYYIKSKNGFIMYCQNDTINYISLSLSIEIAEFEIHVNYYARFAYSDGYINLDNDNMLKFLAKLGYIFGINDIYIHQDYRPCSDFEEYKTIKESKKRIAEMFYYKKDYYDYFKNKTKRFTNESSSIVPLFYYYQLDKLFTTSPSKILNKNDRDEIYQLYTAFLLTLNDYVDNCADFYIYILKNRPDYILIFEEKMEKLFTNNNNPFIIDYYKFSGYTFLYNKRIIAAIPKILERKKINNEQFLNKTSYRLLRDI